MEIENHLIKNIEYIKSPNFNERSENYSIKLLVIHAISLPPNEYGRDYVEKFPIKVVNSNFQVQKPGHICPPHHDNFNMIKDMGFDEKPYRILVCMSDWMFGQVIMIEDLVITQWKKGDAYIWDSEALHMSANGSIGDKLTMIISGFYED